MSESEGLGARLTRWADVAVEPMSPFIGRQYVVGTGVMLARVLLKKGAHVPLHSHPNEQVAYILQGSLRFALEGREVSVRAGEVLCIPPHVPHEAWALEDTVDLDVFHPPRHDWISGNDGYLRTQGEPGSATEVLGSAQGSAREAAGDAAEGAAQAAQGSRD